MLYEKGRETAGSQDRLSGGNAISVPAVCTGAGSGREELRGLPGWGWPLLSDHASLPDRGGMIQTCEQYQFVHHVMSLYEKQLSRQSPE